MDTTTIGADEQRVDGREKVRGSAIYGADRILPRMVHAVPVVATAGKGVISRIDSAAAEKVDGVLIVLTHLNMDRLKPVQFAFAGGQAIQSFQPMQSADIAYRGQAVALVVAEELEAANEAAALVRVDYKSVPFAVKLDAEDGEAVKQAEATAFFKDFIHGAPEDALPGAAATLDQVYRTSPQHQNPMEMLSTVAEWDRDTLVVHEGSQATQAVKLGLAIQLGIQPDKVRVIGPYVGGGFGQRGSISPHTLLAAVAARRTGRPVKLMVPRAQIFHATSFRAATEHRIRIGMTASGKLVAGIHEVRSQTSRFDLMPYTGQETTSRMYGWPAFRGSTTLVKLDTQTPGFMRAPMEMGSAFALESAMDEMAYKLAMDPVALRILNDAQHDPISGKRFSSRRLKECLERGAEKFGWSRRDPRPGSMRDEDGTPIGWGVAAGAYPGYICPAVADVRLNANGTVELSVGGHEMGQGIRTAIAVVVAAVLGVDPQRVRITIGDTIAPPQHTTAGSWGLATATPPVQEACLRVVERLSQVAAAQEGSPLHGADPKTLRLSNGFVAADAGAKMSVLDIMRAAGLAHIDGQANGSAPGMRADAMEQANAGKVAIAGPEFPGHVTFSYIAHFAEVKINPRLPRPRVMRMISVVDCGKVVSRRTALSQVYGGLVWGVGAALSEASEVDPRFGGFLNNNIAEYQIAVNADIRHCEVEFIDEPDFTFNRIGAKGVGEVPCVGAAAAIANAVHHATGTRIRSLPIRIEDLMA
jgi:xanthine dehydrogenase YagR molybdenum-binding subunit